MTIVAAPYHLYYCTIPLILPRHTTYTTTPYHLYYRAIPLILPHHTTYTTEPYHLYYRNIPLILPHHTPYTTAPYLLILSHHTTYTITPYHLYYFADKEKHAEKSWMIACANAPCLARCSRGAHAQLLLVLLARRARFRTQAGWRHPSLQVHCCQLAEITAAYF